MLSNAMAYEVERLIWPGVISYGYNLTLIGRARVTVLNPITNGNYVGPISHDSRVQNSNIKLGGPIGNFEHFVMNVACNHLTPIQRKKLTT